MDQPYTRFPGPLPGMVVQRDRHGDRHSFHMPLADPGWVPAASDGRMLPDDAVVAFMLEDRPYAIPWWVLKNHHVANLTFESGPVMAVL